jgi:hypothetical protein
VKRLGVVLRWFGGCWFGGVGLLVWRRLVSRGVRSASWVGWEVVSVSCSGSVGGGGGAVVSLVALVGTVKSGGGGWEFGVASWQRWCLVVAVLG